MLVCAYIHTQYSSLEEFCAFLNTSGQRAVSVREVSWQEVHEIVARGYSMDAGLYVFVHLFPRMILLEEMLFLRGVFVEDRILYGDYGLQGFQPLFYFGNED